MKLTILLAVFLIGCSEVKPDSTNPCPKVETNERVGPWIQTGPIKVRYGGMYFPALEYPDGTVRRLNFCSSYPLLGVREGMMIDLRYREVNRYVSIEDPCDEFENYKILKDVKE